MNKKIYGLAFSAIALGMLASCSNENGVIDEPNSGYEGELPAMQLAQAPDLVIWSGNQTLQTPVQQHVRTKMNMNIRAI